MRIYSLFFILIFLPICSLQAQVCVPDSSIYGTDQLVSPAPYTPTDPVIHTVPACIGEPYEMSVTFNIPDTFSIPSFPGVALPLTSASIATTGGITGMPVGLSYTCDPPNCSFNANTLGCVLITGTPASSNMIGNFSLAIAITAITPSFPFPLTINYPTDIGAGNFYYIQVRSAGMCVVGTNDIYSDVNSIKNIPNPFGQLTTFKIDAKSGGDFRFEVFDMMGQRVYDDQVVLTSGANEFTFDAGNLPNGSYYYSVGNAQGKASQMMVIAR